MNRLLALPTLFILVCSAACSAPSSSATQGAAATASAVQTVDSTAGQILADGDGLSLYTFDHDTTSLSTCYKACASAWPALLVDDASTLAAPFGVSARTDHTMQVTKDGHPLYRFSGDGAQGDINGDGLGGIWHLARP